MIEYIGYMAIVNLLMGKWYEETEFIATMEQGVADLAEY